MATDTSLVADQTAQEHVEEVKLIDDAIKDVVKDIHPEPKDLEGKDEEKIKLEDLAGAEASTTESAAAIAPEEKQDDKKDEPAAVEVTKEEAEEEKAPVPSAADATEKEETSKQEADSSTADSKVEVDSSAAVERAVEAVDKELKDQVEVTDLEPPKSSLEASAGNLQAASVQESEPEPAMEPAVSEPTTPEAAAEEVNITKEAAAEEVNTTPEAPEAAAEEANVPPEAAATTPEAVVVGKSHTPEAVAGEVISVTEGKEAELPVVSPVTEPAPVAIAITDASEEVGTSQGDTVPAKPEESIETSKEEPSVTDSSIPEEVSDTVVSETADAAAPVKEIKEEAEAAAVAVTKEVPSVPKSAEGDQNASASAEGSIPVDNNPVIESVADKIEEAMQEKAVVAEEPIVSDTTTVDAATQATQVSSDAFAAVEKAEEKKEATVEGSAESSKDPTTAADVPQVTSEGEKASEGVEDSNDGTTEGEKTTLVETARDLDLEEGKSNVSTEGEKTVKDDEKLPVESEKDAGEAPKAEAPAKSPRQSNNIFTKMKQSIVKVKKAIVGKSPNSKALPSEGKDDIKVK